MYTKYLASLVKIKIKDQSAISLLAAVFVMAAMLCTPVLTFASGGRAALKQTGTPSSGTINLYPAGVTFFDQYMGTLGPSQPVTLTNHGTTSLSITKITASLSFTQTNNCGTVLSAGASCTIQVTFTPTLKGSVKGTLSMGLNGKPVSTKVKMIGSGS